MLLAPPTGRRGSIPPERMLSFRRTAAAELGVEVEGVTNEGLRTLLRLGEGLKPSERICKAASANPTYGVKFVHLDIGPPEL